MTDRHIEPAEVARLRELIARVPVGVSVRASSMLVDYIDSLYVTRDDHRQCVVDLVVACGRMLDDWAEGDEAVKASLWRHLHEAAERVDEVWHIYPLDGAA